MAVDDIVASFCDDLQIHCKQKVENNIVILLSSN